MYAGGIIKRITGLTYDKLAYFVRAGYVTPKKIKKESLYYNDFSEEDIELIKRAWRLISHHNLRTRAAFKRARQESEDTQLSLRFRQRK